MHSVEQLINMHPHTRQPHHLMHRSASLSPWRVACRWLKQWSVAWWRTCRWWRPSLMWRARSLPLSRWGPAEAWCCLFDAGLATLHGRSMCVLHTRACLSVCFCLHGWRLPCPQALDKLMAEWEAAEIGVLAYRDSGTHVIKVSTVA